MVIATLEHMVRSFKTIQGQIDEKEKKSLLLR